MAERDYGKYTKDGTRRYVVSESPGGAPVWLEGTEPEWHATATLIVYGVLLPLGLLLAGVGLWLGWW